MAYLDDNCDSKVEPFSSEDYESDQSSNDDEGSCDDKEAHAPITNEKKYGHLVGKIIPRRKCS